MANIRITEITINVATGERIYIDELYIERSVDGTKYAELVEEIVTVKNHLASAFDKLYRSKVTVDIVIESTL